MKLAQLLIVALVLTGCPPHPPTPTPDAAPPVPADTAPPPSDASAPTNDGGADSTHPKTTLTIRNRTDAGTTVNIAFGADSVVLPANWTFCTGSGLNCAFPLAANGTQPMPLGGQYLNATVTFNAPVGCNTTKAELNLNNEKWYDIADISLVDGYSLNMMMTVGNVKLGPTKGKTGNEKVMGVYPYGCDICVTRQNPPCGISKGTAGCKKGKQYKPDVFCQFQGPFMGGGSPVTLSLVP